MPFLVFSFCKEVLHKNSMCYLCYSQKVPDIIKILLSYRGQFVILRVGHMLVRLSHGPTVASRDRYVDCHFVSSCILAGE